MSEQEEGHEHGDQDPLKKQFQILEEDWNSYKKSIPRHRRSRSSADSTVTNCGEILGLGLLDHSPKKLLSSLQQCQYSPAAGRSAKIIRGRSLLEALESVKDDASPKCSTCSSVVMQDQEGLGSCSGSCSSLWRYESSSSSLVSSRREVVDEKERRSGEERWVARITRVFIAVWVVVAGIILVVVGFGAQEYGEYVTPT